MNKALSPLFHLSLCTLGCLYASSTQAQVTQDNTVSTQVTPKGNVAEITGGETRGGNLFHSFRDFSVSTGNEAFFNNATDISNIFSRVTGGKISNINGLIRANGSANLFLINPAGIVFGENASLNIGGSFYGSSASSILFEDGEFSAVDLDNPPVLTINAPIGLGFRDNPGDIVNRSASPNPNGETNVTGGTVGLQVPNGETLALIGGNVLLDDGNLTVKGGQIEIGSVLGEGEIGISETDIDFVLDYDSINSFGDITLQDTAVVDVTASGGGSINVAAKNLSLKSSSLNAGIAVGLGSPDAQAGNIILKATDSVSATKSSQIISFADGQGNAGNVNITARNTISFDGRGENDSFPSGIFTGVGSEANGKGGDINIDTGSLSITNRAQLSSNTSGLGNAGNISIKARDQVSLVNSILISEVSEEGGVGKGGDINIDTGSLILKDGSALLADSESQGDAGNILINARDRILMEGKGFSAFANDTEIVPNQITSTTDSRNVEIDVEGKGGKISISTRSLSITDKGFIKTSTFGKGDAGNLDISAFQGIRMTKSSLISSGVEEGATGNAGGVDITAKNLSITNGSYLNASTLGEGDAGNIKINVSDAISIDGSQSSSFTGIASQVGEKAIGRGGNVFIGNEQSSVEQLNVTNGGRISASTLGQGKAGNLSIYANNLAISGQGDSNSGLFAQVTPEATGQGGNIILGSEQSPVKNLSIIDDATISVSTFSKSGQGNAGDLTITTEKLLLESGGELQAISFKNGNAGDLTINALESIKVIGTAPDGQSPSGIFASAFDGTGNGGNLSIATDELIIQDQGTLAVGNFQIVFDKRPLEGSGEPGNLDIKANSITLNNGGGIDAATQSAQSEIGKSGVINLRVTEDITLRNNSFISARAFKNADGGNLNIDARFIVAYPSNSTGNDLVATADNGNGGKIDLNVEQIFGLQPGNAINSSSNFINNKNNDIDVSSNIDGLDGSVNINTSDINPVQGTTELPSNVVEAKQTADQTCSTNREGKASNGLTISGRGGVHPAPDSPLSSHNIIDAETNSAYNIPAPIETSQGKIQPARGIKVTKDGRIILTAYRTNDAGERIPEIKPNCSNLLTNLD